MGKKEIYILGVGRNTEVYIDLVEACGFKPAGLYHYNDERIGESIHGVKILDTNENLFGTNSLEGKYFAISVGDIKIRNDINSKIRQLGGQIPKLIHPNANVSKYSIVEEGVVINANSIVQAGAIVKKDTVITYNVTIAHTSVIGECCQITAGSIIGAYVSVHNFVFIGMGSIILSSKVKYIGKNAIIGAGSVVTKNVEANTVVAGNPAKVLKK